MDQLVTFGCLAQAAMLIGNIGHLFRGAAEVIPTTHDSLSSLTWERWAEGKLVSAIHAFGEGCLSFNNVYGLTSTAFVMLFIYPL